MLEVGGTSAECFYTNANHQLHRPLNELAINDTGSGLKKILETQTLLSFDEPQFPIPNENVHVFPMGVIFYCLWDGMIQVASEQKGRIIQLDLFSCHLFDYFYCYSACAPEWSQMIHSLLRASSWCLIAFDAELPFRIWSIPPSKKMPANEYRN